MTRIVAKGRVVYADDPRYAQATAKESLFGRFAFRTDKVLGYAALGTIAILFGGALIGEFVIDHQVKPEIATGFIIFTGGLVNFYQRRNHK
jgi:hypothetical protein